MKKWAMAFIVCLEVISNVTRATGPSELKVLTKRIAAIQAPAEISSEMASYDQRANMPLDRSLVKNIRSELVNDSSLSKSGKNVQIIVVGKEITIKGAVTSDREQSRIMDIANKFSEKHKIRNQIEVIRE